MKRSYGLPIDYYQISEHTTDPETGEKTTTLSKTHIRKAIVLRAREFRSFVYDLAYISANKDFTTGGFFDPEDRQIIIDSADVSIDFEPNVEDFFIFQNLKYEVKEVFHFENNSLYAMLARKLRGNKVVRKEETLSVLDLQHTSDNYIKDLLLRDPSSLLILTQEIKEVP